MSSSPPSRVHTVSVTQPHAVPSRSSSGYAATSHPSPPGEGASAGEDEYAAEGKYEGEVGGGRLREGEAEGEAKGGGAREGAAPR